MRREGAAIMSTTTAPHHESEDSFGSLMDRLNSVIHRLKLAAEDLGEVAETPDEEHHSAAFVVVEVTKELVQLQRDLENWTIRYFPGERTRRSAIILRTYWDQLEPLPMSDGDEA
jgi:hypothetical protein